MLMFKKAVVFGFFERVFVIVGGGDIQFVIKSVDVKLGDIVIIFGMIMLIIKIMVEVGIESLEKVWLNCYIEEG